MAGLLCSFITPLFYLITLLHGVPSTLPTFQHPINNDRLAFLVIGDWGRRGEFNQSQVTFQMGRIGEEMDIDFVVSTGDNSYDNGLTGDHDTAFRESFSDVYTATSLLTPWYIVLGNHDYRGDAIAQLSPYLRKVDPRWVCLRSFIVTTGDVAEIFMVDTTPFVDMYFTDAEDHTYDWRGILPRSAYLNTLLEELDSALRRSTAKWKIVVGHHAIRSVGHHGDTVELVKHLLPILQLRSVRSAAMTIDVYLLKWCVLCLCIAVNDVDFYVNGHDHCLEHISDTNSPIKFLTSGAGSKAWRGDTKGVSRNDVDFFYDGQGFMSMTVNPSELHIAFYDVEGRVLHSSTTAKQLRVSS